jgi:plasmid stability protein
MKTTVDLPDNLFRQIKLRAVKSGQKLKETIAELLRKGLEASSQSRASERPVIQTHPETGFPYFGGAAEAPARQMTTAELLALEQATQLEEDLERLRVSR